MSLCPYLPMGGIWGSKVGKIFYLLSFKSDSSTQSTLLPTIWTFHFIPRFWRYLVLSLVLFLLFWQIIINNKCWKKTYWILQTSSVDVLIIRNRFRWSKIKSIKNFNKQIQDSKRYFFYLFINMKSDFCG